MDKAYLSWLGFLLGGGLLGLFLKPRTVGIVFLLLFAVAVIGLIAAIAMSHEKLTWVFGLSAMAISAIGPLAALGAFAVSRLRMKRQR